MSDTIKAKIFIKKYSYLTRERLLKNILLLRLRLKSILIRDHSSLKLDILNVEALPYPVRWEQVCLYKKLFVEIGSGHGELLQSLASKYDSDLFIGFEISKQFAVRTFKRVKDLKNAFIFKGEGYSNVLNLFKTESIDGIYILFPDPWHKKRHQKRRPLQKDWFKNCYLKLKEGGFIFFATDWEEYYQFVADQLNGLDQLYRIEYGSYKPEDQELPETHYYKKWLKLNRKFQFIKMTKRK